MKHVMIVLTLCMLVACGRSQQETSLAWKTDSLVRMSDSTLLIHMVYPVLTDTGAVADSINRRGARYDPVGIFQLRLQ